MATTWLRKRRLSTVVSSGNDAESQPSRLTLDRSADEYAAAARERGRFAGARSSTAEVRRDARSAAESSDASLDEIWAAVPQSARPGALPVEGYDAVSPEELGAVWLERATQTTHDERPHARDQRDGPDSSGNLLVSEATLAWAHNTENEDDAQPQED